MTDNAPRHTQTSRRIKYGLNVSVALVAALVLVVLVNWIAFRHMPRWDLTGSGRYTLAGQTRQVLGQLEHDHEIVTLFRVTSTQLERVRDLVEEYARHSPRLTVTHIDPDRDIAARQRFYEGLRERFGDDLAPAAEAVDTGRHQLVQLMTALPQELAPELRAMLEHPELTDESLRQIVPQIVSIVGRFDRQLEAVNDRLDEALDTPMPDYAQAATLIEGALRELTEGLLSPAIDRFDRAVDRRGVPNAVKQTLLEQIEAMEAAQAAAQQAAAALSNVNVPTRYDQLRRELRGIEAVVVLGPERVQAIPAAELQRQVDPQLARAAGGEPELQFLGEERITGALAGMQLEQRPMVVFVSLGAQPALGDGGRYMHVAERLASANFEVEQWSPRGGGAMHPMQRQQPANTQPPRPDPGQPVVWVVLPGEAQDPMMAAMGGDGADAEVIEHLRDRVSRGEGALVMLGLDTGGAEAAAGVPGPMTRWLRTWGIEPGLDRVLMRESGPSERTRPELELDVSRWPGGMPVTDALAGMRGIFMAASPLELRADGHATHWPLIEVRGERLWAEPVANLTSQAALRDARYDASRAADVFTLGVAAEHREDDVRQRLVVVAEATWASDTVTTAAQLGGQLAPGLAEMFGAAFPANSELFVNSVYWLAGLDEMIAASPRTQDIRRIGAMSDGRLRAYQLTLMLGLPVLVLAMGVGVWLVRRRG